MDVKLKEAIAAVRAGDRATAQQQLTTLLEENPKEAQGWYLLSLLVDSPQKQAAYLSKTLALDPNHSKAHMQLATLQGANRMAPTSTINTEMGMDMDASVDFLDQADDDSLPDWLQGEQFERKEKPAEQSEETAVPNETLPDWLKEPVLLADEKLAIEESPTMVGPTAQSDDKVDQTVSTLRQKSTEKTTQSPAKKIASPKAQKAASKNATGLNIALGVLVLLAIVVMVLLAYLIFS
ncbi:MAG: hypothetical protein IPJ90_20760 [Anaerolineaceae bacterium]|nr:hypothetical protein [Anaerolineaceae bacterium]